MPDGPERDADTGAVGMFMLCLRLGGSDPPSGTIGPVGEATTPFSGWIALMSAINQLRGAQDTIPPDTDTFSGTAT